MRINRGIQSSRDQRRRSLLRAVTVGVTAAVAAAGLVAVEPTGPTASAARNFYAPPKSFSATPGSVIRSEHSNLLLQIPGVKGQLPGTATRIMYTSTLQSGKPTAVTGTVVQPSAPWRGKGERPTVVLGSGTIGQGDQCAPSKLMELPLAIDVTKPSLGVNYTGLEMNLLLLNGVRVVLTDYVGLGTPGVHTYVNRLETGHAMLDAARAGLAVAKASKNAPVGFSGYSQGGAAAASAAELAETYAPDLNVKGSYAGAPPADLNKVINQIDGTFIAGGIGYAINGLAARYPAFGPILKRELSAHGLRVLKMLSTQCIADAALSSGFQRTSSWTRSGESLGSIIARYPEVQQMIADQRIGKLKPNAPVYLATGKNDDVIPTGQVYQLYRDWKAQGAQVRFSRDYIPPIFPGLVVNHVLPMVAHLLPGVNFLLNAFNR